MKGARIIVVAGDIGSGKSIVGRILSAVGHAVYDCDSRAKMIMDSSGSIKSAIATIVSEEVIRPDHTIDRERLAEIVFADAGKLKALNGIVHSAVRDDILRVANRQPDGSILFVETAIAHESGIDVIADEIWLVEAPEHMRIERVERRSGLSETQVLARIRSQAGETDALRENPKTKVIVNDGVEPLLPQVLARISELYSRPFEPDIIGAGKKSIEILPDGELFAESEQRRFPQ